MSSIILNLVLASFASFFLLTIAINIIDFISQVKWDREHGI